MKKRHVSKKLVAFIMCGAMLVPTGAFAGESVSATATIDDYASFVHSARSAENVSAEALDYIQSAMDTDALNDILADYQDKAGSKTATYEMFQANLDSTYAEVEANGFDKEQAAQLFQSAVDLETGNADMSDWTYSDEAPDCVPSHDQMTASERLINSNEITLLSNSDRSSRTSYETGGVGYEVQSLAGYNKSTSYFYPGSCNVNLPSNEDGTAAYMFYTIGYGGNAQDLGVVYYHGFWQPVCWGYWTGWGTSSKHLAVGDKLYFKIWIGTDQQIYFQGIDGDDFSNILFEGIYSSWGMLPSSGSGVTWNRQVTFVDNAQDDNSGYYLRNARFDQSYLYNNYSYAPFNDSNTNSSRRGKFGCTWANDSHVTINSNTHWSSENITIQMS